MVTGISMHGSLHWAHAHLNGDKISTMQICRTRKWGGMRAEMPSTAAGIIGSVGKACRGQLHAILSWIWPRPLICSGGIG